MILVKFWMHVTDEEQLRRFEGRAADPLKRWKLTEEDWRNREKNRLYDAAAEEMFLRTEHKLAPWDIIGGEQKRYARIAVLETVIRRVEEAWCAGASRCRCRSTRSKRGCARTELASTLGRVRQMVGRRCGPGLSGFELRRHPEQQVLAAVGGDQLHADRQALGRPVQGQADGRLAAGVERRGERHVLRGAHHRRHRAVRVVGERADRDRRLAQRGREQQVPAVGPPLLHGAAELDVGGQRHRVVDAVDAAGELGLRLVDRLDVAGAELATELRGDAG